MNKNNLQSTIDQYNGKIEDAKTKKAALLKVRGTVLGGGVGAIAGMR